VSVIGLQWEPREVRDLAMQWQCPVTNNHLFSGRSLNVLNILRQCFSNIAVFTCHLVKLQVLTSSYVRSVLLFIKHILSWKFWGSLTYVKTIKIWAKKPNRLLQKTQITFWQKSYIFWTFQESKYTKQMEEWLYSFEKLHHQQQSCCNHYYIIHYNYIILIILHHTLYILYNYIYIIYIINNNINKIFYILYIITI
jgi:hypothetical protein